MREWWLNLLLREKKIVALGTVLISLFIFYELIFASLAGRIDHLRNQIHKSQTLLSWMQESDARIQFLEKNRQVTNHNTSSSLLSRVQDDINKNRIAKNISQLSQAENNAIELHFQQVSFDDMMQWLITICRQQNITINQMQITPIAQSGIVDVELKLQTA